MGCPLFSLQRVNSPDGDPELCDVKRVGVPVRQRNFPESDLMENRLLGNQRFCANHFDDAHPAAD